jgi:hypothetical protein
MWILSRNGQSYLSGGKNMNKIIRNIVFGIGVALALVCGFVSIYAFYCGVVDEDPESWVAFFVFAVGSGIGDVLLFVFCPPRIAAYIADAFRLGGKQMLCDIIKWTIIIVIVAIVFTIAYKIAISDYSLSSQRGR